MVSIRRADKSIVTCIDNCIFMTLDYKHRGDEGLRCAHDSARAVWGPWEMEKNYEFGGS